ncbi:MAG: glycosyltransferase family 2 protein [Deltaproteobacteria bacterium]
MPGAARATVVVPAWGAAATLSRTLDALIDGNGAAIDRIIVVASPGDASAKIAASYSAVTVLRPQHRLTAGAARNLGRTEAGDAKRLIFVDADCRLAPGAAAALLAALEADQGLAAVAPALVRDGGGPLAWTRHALEFKEWGRDGPARPLVFVPSAVLACRPALLDRAGGFPDMWPGEDLVLCHRLVEQGLRLAILRQVVARHRHPTGLGTMLLHQYRLGYSSALARLQTGMKGVTLARVPLLAPLLLPARAVRALLWFTTCGIRGLPAFVLTLPLYLAGLVAWTVGFTRCAFGQARA